MVRSPYILQTPGAASLEKAEQPFSRFGKSQVRGLLGRVQRTFLLLFPLAVRAQFTKRCAESKHKSGFFMTLRFAEGVYCGVLMKDILHAIPLYHSDKTFRDSLRPGWISGVSKVSSTPTLAFSMDSIRLGSFSIGFGCLDDRILFLTEVYECGRKLWILSMPLKGFRVFFFHATNIFAGSPLFFSLWIRCSREWGWALDRFAMKWTDMIRNSFD